MRFTTLILVLALCGCRSAPELAVKKAPVEVPTSNNTIESDCQAGNSGSCLMLGVRYERGDEVARNVDTAFEFYEKSCELGSAHGCYSKALVLLHERHNPIQAIPFLEYGCDSARHGPSCLALGDIVREGRIHAKDEAVALKRYRQACETGFQLGCNAYIRHLWTASKQLVRLKEFVSFLEKHCESGHEMSCNEVADLYLSGEQWGDEVIQPDRGKADQWRNKIARARRLQVRVDKQIAPPPPDMPAREAAPGAEPPPFVAAYVVVSGRNGASIVIDGVDTGKASPATVMLFTGGRHIVQLRGQDGKLSKEKIVWLDSAGRVELVFE